MVHTPRIIRKLKKAAGITTQEQLAEVLGKKQSVVSRIESGTVGISLEDFINACKKLNVDPCSVISEDEMIKLEQENALERSINQ